MNNSEQQFSLLVRRTTTSLLRQIEEVKKG